MPIEKLDKSDITVFNCTLLDAKWRGMRLHQRVAADQQNVAERLATSQSSLSRAAELISVLTGVDADAAMVHGGRASIMV